jgi:hypothetical protein
MRLSNQLHQIDRNAGRMLLTGRAAGVRGCRFRDPVDYLTSDVDQLSDPHMNQLTRGQKRQIAYAGAGVGEQLCGDSYAMLIVAHLLVINDSAVLSDFSRMAAIRRGTALVLIRHRVQRVQRHR